jgi:hypothetical protein
VEKGIGDLPVPDDDDSMRLVAAGFRGWLRYGFSPHRHNPIVSPGVVYEG